ncbi:MAG TPA: MBL fold metallo-hydrolase [Chitinophagaceae bacterium]|jgi:phosphoribosyl 1,2-cyclic phosphodiesterase|nr:MBL fold metallo-hydrolase [Chitinophagaceae bacterium]
MSLFITSLNSGSNANCYYIGTRHEAVLIDAGLSCRETEKRMRQLELSMEKVRAIFVSHEHSDHITGLAGLSKKFRLPVYITGGTLSECTVPVQEELVCSFQKNKAVRIGGLSVMPFKKSHDAADPHSFMVSGNGVNIGIITDIGYACKQVIKYFSQCQAVFLESNYCDDMLSNGNYPYYLKNRISSDEGHLSNAQALELFTHYRSPDLQLLILSHLSKNNNKPELVESIFSKLASTTRIVVASRYEATPVFCIENKNGVIPNVIKQRKMAHEKQLSLF